MFKTKILILVTLLLSLQIEKRDSYYLYRIFHILVRKQLLLLSKLCKLDQFLIGSTNSHAERNNTLIFEVLYTQPFYN